MSSIQTLKAAVPVWVKQPVKQFLVDRGVLRAPPPTAGNLDHMTQRASFARIAARNLGINSVVDVGASDGHWSIAAEEFWPNARYHLIEAYDHWRPALDSLTARKSNYSYSLAAAGARDGGLIPFTNSKADPFGGVAGPGATSGDHWTVPAISIDAEVERLKLRPPYLVKLDTHGFEREILEGASQTLRRTNLLINEFYNFHSEERRWPQMVMLVESMGFRCVDLIEPLWRSDGVLWQMDFAFIRRDRPEFLSEGFIVPH